MNAYLHGFGGGTGLNFHVKAYASQDALPETAAENTIAVFTDHEITGWEFGTSAPGNPFEGLVWIFTGTSSPVAFNALKKNCVNICPISAKQYISGAWVNKTAKSYQDGAWVDWWDGYFFKSGFESTVPWTWLADSSSSVDITATMINLNCPEGGMATAYTEETVDLSGFKTLYFEHVWNAYMGVATSVKSYKDVAWVACIGMDDNAGTNDRKVTAVDISKVNSGYIVIQSPYGSDIYNVWAE